MGSKMEKILAFQVKEEQLGRIRRAAGNLKVRVETVAAEHFRQNLGELEKQADAEPVQVYDGEVPEQSLLVFCNIENKKLDKLLAALRKNQVQVDYKAVLTPTNRTWNILRIYAEMEREKRAYEEMKG